ncbi:uncharacterized membrane protein YkvA (DUF1232 family) [Anaerosolibacter carboniphilus]|uniref:Uncharacterized membrane protein YkvA (DUF1232 family) n=1 Tax=Anaerosolibacter carboniphilus TaxID=1417629 RepID=A0A841KMJ1_9FIRM|nr:YkvA family protein [Anaerosolibacter carboniphilus]MBB6214657.1 uncharacterized membrane protein YkvA (DUF1232 family) [Anaerosolibacter carboniphilus]
MKGKERNEILIVIKRLPKYTKLVYHLYKASFVTRKQKLLLSTAMGYLISPIELIPGFIPVMGQVDDLIIVLTILKRVLKANKNEMIQDLLLKQGLTLESIDEDIRISMEVAKGMMRKAGRFMGRSLLWTGKASISFGKKVFGRKSKKNMEIEKES